jgi:hypothetical protein
MRHIHALAASLLLAEAASLGTPPKRAPNASNELVVHARYPGGDQGTTHFAEELTITAGSAKTLHISGDDVPVPGPSFRLPGSRYVLLGWSSVGGGLQSIHAYLLVVQDGKLKRLASLKYQTDRANSSILVRRMANGSVQLGLPEPPTQIHEPFEWSLSTGADTTALRIGEIRRLTYEDAAPVKGDLFYSPPFEAAKGQGPSRVSWISIAPDGFLLARGPGPSR